MKKTIFITLSILFCEILFSQNTKIYLKDNLKFEKDVIIKKTKKTKKVSFKFKNTGKNAIYFELIRPNKGASYFVNGEILRKPIFPNQSGEIIIQGWNGKELPSHTGIYVIYSEKGIETIKKLNIIDEKYKYMVKVFQMKKIPKF